MLIENEQYLYACGVYIEENPLKAGMVKENIEWKYSSSGHYAGKLVDELVNDYELPAIPEDRAIKDEDFFTRGAAIGSDWFKFHLRKNLNRLSPGK